VAVLTLTIKMQDFVEQGVQIFPYIRAIETPRTINIMSVFRSIHSDLHLTTHTNEIPQATTFIRPRTLQNIFDTFSVTLI
jgi:hypothetical protein